MARGIAVPRRATESASSRCSYDGDCTTTPSFRSGYRAASTFHRARFAPQHDDEPFGSSAGDDHDDRSAAGTTSESDWASAGVEALDSRTAPERDGRGETGSQGRRVEVPGQAGASRRAIGTGTGTSAGAIAGAGAECGSDEPKPACCLKSAHAGSEYLLYKTVTTISCKLRRLSSAEFECGREKAWLSSESVSHNSSAPFVAVQEAVRRSFATSVWMACLRFDPTHGPLSGSAALRRRFVSTCSRPFHSSSPADRARPA